MTTTKRGKVNALSTEPVVGEVARPDGSQEALPTVQFGVQADECTLGEAVVEIGDEADRVRQFGARIKCRAALVVNEHERHVVRAELSGESNHQAAQQLALARTRRTRNERMRPVSHQIHLDQAVDGMSQRRRWCGVRTSRPPSFDEPTSSPRRWRTDQHRVDIAERNGGGQSTRLTPCTFRVREARESARCCMRRCLGDAGHPNVAHLGRCGLVVDAKSPGRPDSDRSIADRRRRLLGVDGDEDGGLGGVEIAAQRAGPHRKETGVVDDQQRRPQRVSGDRIEERIQCHAIAGSRRSSDG